MASVSSDLERTLYDKAPRFARYEQDPRPFPRARKKTVNAQCHQDCNQSQRLSGYGTDFQSQVHREFEPETRGPSSFFQLTTVLIALTYFFSSVECCVVSCAN